MLFLGWYLFIFSFGVTPPIWALAYLHETLRFIIYNIIFKHPVAFRFNLYIVLSINPSIMHFGLLDLGHSVGPWAGQFVARPLPVHKHRKTRAHSHIHTHTHSMPWVGFEPTVPASERAKTMHALDGSATVTGLSVSVPKLIWSFM
jgi:hypothetical protein